jgi:hypothetical protein
MSWQKTLVFPAEVPISEQARDTIVRFCCEAEHRAGSQHGLDDIKNMPFFKVRLTVISIINSQHGLDDIKNMPFFKG